MTPTLQQIDELKLSLDPSLKPLLSSEETGEINYSLWLQHQITKPEQRRAMLEATFFFVLGLITPQEFAGRIALLKEGEANQRALLNDIVRQRFVPYREAFLRTGRDLTVFENIAFPPITPTPPVPSNLAAPFPPPPQKTPVLTPLSLQKPEMPQSTIPRITISPTPPGRRPEPMPIPIQPIRYAPPPKSVEVPKVIKPIDNAQSLKSFDAAQDLRPFDTAQDLRPFDTAQGVKPINENEQAGQVKPARPAQEPLKSSEQVGQMNPEPKPAEQTRPVEPARPVSPIKPGNVRVGPPASLSNKLPVPPSPSTPLRTYGPSTPLRSSTPRSLRPSVPRNLRLEELEETGPSTPLRSSTPRSLRPSVPRNLRPEELEETGPSTNSTNSPQADSGQTTSKNTLDLR